LSSDRSTPGGRCLQRADSPIEIRNSLEYTVLMFLQARTRNRAANQMRTHAEVG
jgi:hypothetical protein